MLTWTHRGTFLPALPTVRPTSIDTSFSKTPCTAYAFCRGPSTRPEAVAERTRFYCTICPVSAAHGELRRARHGPLCTSSKGLGFGLYGDRGTMDCAKNPGNLGHEVQDANFYGAAAYTNAHCRYHSHICVFHQRLQRQWKSTGINQTRAVSPLQ